MPLWLLLAPGAGAQEPALAEPPEVVELEGPAQDPFFLEFPNPAFPSPRVHAVPVDRGPKVERADLAPYFAEGNRALAKQAYDEGKWDRARALLDAEGDSAPVRYLRALAALRGNDAAFAAKELEALAQSWAPMADRCRIQGAQAYEAQRDFAQAARLYEAVDPSSRVWADARLALSRARRIQRDWKAALEALRPLVDKPAPPYGRDLGAEALMFLADVHLARKEKDPRAEKDEQAALLRLWSAHPVHPWAERAEARLKDLASAPVDAKVIRGEALIEAHRNQAGLAMLEPLLGALKLPDVLACRAHFAYGKGQRKQRKHARAVEVLGPVTKKCKDPDLRARALYTLAYSRGILDPAGSVPLWKQLAAEFPGHPYADDGLFMAADALGKVSLTDQALELLQTLVERYPDGDQAADAMFRRFWILRAQGRTDEALAQLDGITRRFVAAEDAHERERAGYWRARVLEARGEAAAALDAWAEIALQHPASYYGLVSLERLAERDPARHAALTDAIRPPAESDDPFPIYAGPLASEPGFAAAVELLRLGLSELVASEVLSVDRVGLPADSVRLLVLLLSLAGEERAAHGMARLWLKRDFSGRITKANRALWQVGYPQAFRDLVVKHAQAADALDPDLLQALMREESALDARALSWAGAMGLCQLMPATAAGVAMQLKLKRPTTQDLLDPDLNIRLGSRYLADLLRRQAGLRQYALASYNAGEGAVARWRRDAAGADLDEWVERIPLAETRGYVKRVLRSFVTYRMLYGTFPVVPPRAASAAAAPAGRP